MMGPSKKAKHRLIVEGRDDQHAVIHLLKRHGIEWDDPSEDIPFIEDANGVSNMLTPDSVSANLKNYRRVGWILDADIHPTDRWRSIRRLMESSGLSVTETPEPDGTIIEGLRSGSRVGVWLMPDNRSPGMLEDFLAKLVPATDTSWPLAEESTDQALELAAGIEVKDRSKGVIHAWLAWQKEPGLPLGTALTARILGHDSPESRSFVSWFKRLFIE